MNAFELRKLILSDAPGIIEESRERMRSSIDPLTGEKWDGDNNLFMLTYKALLKFAEKPNDPLPPIDHGLPFAKKLQLIMDMMFSGEIDTPTADNMVNATVHCMSALQKQHSQDKLDELTNVADAVRLLELQDMTDAELADELQRTKDRMMGDMQALDPVTTAKTNAAINYQLLLDEQEKRACENSLAQFIKSSWHIIEPGTELIWNWHLDVMCAYMEAVHTGAIKRLIINIPPGTMKSTVVSVGYPAWKWTKNQDHRFLGITNEQGLALRDALKARTILDSAWFKSKWSLEFAKDQNTKTLYQNTKRGFRQSLGIRAGIIGKRGDTILIDDPNDATQAESKAHRDAVIDSYDLKLVTRLNEPNVSPIVMVAQRLHVKDLSGHLLGKIKEKWTHLVIPMEYEGSPAYDPVADIGRPDLVDPRTEEGELLFPQRFTRGTIDILKEYLGSYGASGQLQQRPAPRGGGMIKTHWFKRYRQPPKRHPDHVIRLSLDTAVKDKQLNDPSVCGVWQSTEAGHHLIDVWLDKLIYPDLKTKVISLLHHWQPHECLIEDKASGQQLIQDLRRETNFNIIAVTPVLDKETRISNESPAIEAGNVWLPEQAHWLFDYETELEQYPKVDHDDQVDMTSQFLNRVRQPLDIFIG